HSVLRAVCIGEVVAPAWNVFAQVLPKVDELQRCTDGVTLLQRLLVVHAVQMQQQPANRVGRAAAVVEQLSAVGIGGCIARFFNVLNEGAEQIIQQRHGQLV